MPPIISELPKLTRPPRTKHLPWSVLLGGPALLLAITFALASWFSTGSPNQNVTMGDRSFLVTVPELLELTKQPDNGYDPKAEVLRKTVLPRGGRELEYRYLAPKPHWLVSSRVTAELDATQAMATYKQAAETDLKLHSVTLEALPYAWGDESQIGTLQRNGVTVGHYFLGRKGRHVVLYRLENLVLAAPLTFESVIAPHLALAEQFKP